MQVIAPIQTPSITVTTNEAGAVVHFGLKLTSGGSALHKGHGMRCQSILNNYCLPFWLLPHRGSHWHNLSDCCRIGTHTGTTTKSSLDNMAISNLSSSTSCDSLLNSPRRQKPAPNPNPRAIMGHFGYTPTRLPIGHLANIANYLINNSLAQLFLCAGKVPEFDHAWNSSYSQRTNSS